MTTNNDVAGRAKTVFNAIVANDGQVYAVHNDENVLLKTVAVADGKLVGIVAANNGGIKTLDITGDKVVRIRTETILNEPTNDE